MAPRSFKCKPLELKMFEYMFELSISGKLIDPHLRCKTSFTLVPLSLSLSILVVNLLSTNPTKWSKTLKQFVGNLSTNCLSVVDYFVGLALEGLNPTQIHNFHNFSQRLPDWCYYRLFVLEYFSFSSRSSRISMFVPRCKIIVFGADVSCKHALTW